MAQSTNNNNFTLEPWDPPPEPDGDLVKSLMRRQASVAAAMAERQLKRDAANEAITRYHRAMQSGETELAAMAAEGK